MLSEDKKVEILHEHYIDTFNHIRNAVNQRDRYFAYILIIVTIMLLQVVAPKDTDSAIGKLVAEKLSLSGTFSLSVIGTILWFVLLGFVIRYYQTVIFLERQYKYIHSVEALLAENYGGAAFTREGKSYLSDYPPFSKWTWLLYTIVFPLLLVLILALKLMTEFCRVSIINWQVAFDTLTFGLICVSVVLFLISLHRNK